MMIRKMLCACSVMVFIGAVGGARPAMAAADGANAVPGEVRGNAALRQIPPNATITRHYYNPATGAVSAVGGGLVLDDPVYSNTPPPEVYLALGLPNVEVADDLITVAVGGCPVKAFDFTVAGGGGAPCGSPGDQACPAGTACVDDNCTLGPGFNVSFGLYDRCPHSGGVLIPGTSGTLPLPNDGLHTVLVDLSAAPVPMGGTVWMAVSVDGPAAGWVLGTPAEVGFTRNVYDFVFRQCDARFAGTTLYAGFDARIYCEPPFDREFLAYFNSDLTAQQVGLGGSEWLMDDVELIVNDCVLSSYEIGAVGSGGGDVTVTAELRRGCGDSNLITGTEGTATFVADDAPSLARFDFPGGVELGTQGAWMAFKFDRGSRAIVSGEATLGFTDDFFGLSNGAGGCDLFYFPGGPWSGMAINIRCLGDAPKGACCDLSVPTATTPREYCREVKEIACQGTKVRYEQGTKCPDTCSITSEDCTTDLDCPAACSTANDPCVLDTDCPDGETCDRVQQCTAVGVSFQPQCGHSACCLPPESQFGETCRDMNETGCGDPNNQDGAGNPAVWQPGQFCGQGQQDCISWICRFAEGPCDVSHPGQGCNVPTCCDTVCDLDSFCCIFDWDSTCVTRAVTYCGDSLPVGNDDCWSATPGFGAVMLNECGGADCGREGDPECPGGQQCLNFHCDGGNHEQCFADADCPQGQLCLADGATDLRNDGAHGGPDEGFCCHPTGSGNAGFGGVWAKFTATEATARVDTCGANNTPATDALLQVFKATDPTTEQTACDSLVAIGCNDDSDWSSCQDGQAAICLQDLVIGDTYYVLIDSKGAETKGTYRVRVTSPTINPCTGTGGVPTNNSCDLATSAGTTNTFDTTGATLECPSEACASEMTGDVWYVFTAQASGIVTMDTCNEPNQDTILIAYGSNECPATVDDRIICNDNRGLGETCSEITFNVEELQSYRIRIGVRNDDEIIGTLTVSDVSPDCNFNQIADDQDLADCAPGDPNCDDCQPNGFLDQCDILWGLSQDANGNGIPDECEPDLYCTGGVTGSTPAACAIDARQPHDPNDAGALQGWSSITLDLVCVGLETPSEDVSDYTLSDPTLNITSAVAAGNSVTLTFDGPISPGDWTCVTENTGGGKVCIGALPADVDGSRASDPSDIIAVIDCINGTAAHPCEVWNTDADRSGVTDPSDIIMVIDLLNGGSQFTSWFGATLPAEAACP